jgi:hypothetical protein
LLAPDPVVLNETTVGRPLGPLVPFAVTNGDQSVRSLVAKFPFEIRFAFATMGIVNNSEPSKPIEKLSLGRKLIIPSSS